MISSCIDVLHTVWEEFERTMVSIIFWELAGVCNKYNVRVMCSINGFKARGFVVPTVYILKNYGYFFYELFLERKSVMKFSVKMSSW